MPFAVPSRRRTVAPALLALCIAAALAPVAFVAPLHAQETAPAGVRRYDIPAQPLAAAARQFGRVSGLQVVFRSRVADDLRSAAVIGEFDADEALQRLLSGTGLVARRMDGNIIALEAGAAPAAQAGEGDVVVTGALNVAGARTDAGGQARDLRGHDDVYDLDISTAYLGRTEVERYKGATPSDLLNGVAGVFSGDARNSGALDVNIRGVQGPGRVPVTIDGTEQALTVWRGYNGVSNRNYIDPSLIGGIQILKGPSLARNVATGVGGAVVVKTLDVDDFVPEGERFGGEFKIEGSSNAVAPRVPALHTGKDYRDVPALVSSTVAVDPTLRVQPHSGGSDYNVFDGEDYAYRLALGWKSDRFDLMGAYAYRERGNYFAGEHDAGYYARPIENASTDDFITTMANRILPGTEVTNTSSRMESWLFKATWHPGDDQVLRFGYRDSLSHYGEIMPSRISRTVDGVPQWPLSRVDAKAWNLEYKWNPAGSRWIDVYVNLWRTDTDSATYTAGSYPNYWSRWGSNTIISNGALGNSSNARNGVTLSNRLRLADTLDLTVGGNFQHEKLRSRDPYLGPSASWRMFPRAGRREEWEANFNFEWRPLDFLTVTAGARYSSYWAYDDFVAAHPGEITRGIGTYQASYYTKSPAEVAAHEQYWRDFFLDSGFTPDVIETLLPSFMALYTGELHVVPWLPDADGNYDRAGNACLNGSLATLQYLVQNAFPEGACQAGYAQDATWLGYAGAEKRKDRGWAPAFSATAHFSDFSRAYFSYNEVLRYPSMFESTLAFSASINPWGLEPEHVHNWEVAYVHDLGHLLSADTVADVKLAYYVRKTRDLIERNNSFMFDNIDKQTVRGLEFQGRYDNGRFFTDLGVARILENEVCDESTAVMLDPTLGRLPNCVDQGFIGSYLLTQTIPELSANWSLGGRFLDRRLEIGGRVVYYQKRATNDDLEAFRAVTEQNLTVFNQPFSWDDTLVLDAYASYRFNDRLQVELVGTNLGDRYYADPATRSLMPAPGRTLRLSLTARF